MRPMRADESVVELLGQGAWVRVFASLDYEPGVHTSSTSVKIKSIPDGGTLSPIECLSKGASMLTSDSLRSADGRTEATTRRRLLHMAATVAATAPLASLAAGGTAQASPETPATAPRHIRRAVLVPRFGG